MADVVIAQDLFSDTTGVDLNSHTPDLGGSWSRHPGYPDGALSISNANRAYISGGTVLGVRGALYLNGTVPTYTDYTVKATIRQLSLPTDHYSGLCWRWNTSASTGYIVNQLTVGQWQIGKIVSGSYSFVGAAFSHSLSNDTDYVIAVKSVGNTHELFINDVSQGTRTDRSSPITAAGRGGLVSYINATNSTGQHFADFEIIESQTTHPVGTEAVTLAATGFQLSPWNWRLDGDSRATIYPGAYLKRSVKSTYLAINLDVSAMVTADLAADRYPKLLYRVDEGEWTESQVTESPTFKVIFEELADEFHDVEIILLASDAFTARWNETSALKVDSVQMATGWETATLTEPTDTILFYGDSITEGAGLLGAATTGAEYVAYASSVDGYAAHIADALVARGGRVALGGTGWDATWNGDVPSFPNTWDEYSNGNSRLSGGLLNPAPTWIVINHGTNGGVASSSTVANQLTALRTAAPDAKIVLLIPFGQTAVTNLTAGFNRYQSGTPDSLCKLIDLGAIDGIGPSIVTATYRTTDGLHPTQREHSRLAAVLAAEIKDAFAVPGSGWKTLARRLAIDSGYEVAP